MLGGQNGEEGKVEDEVSGEEDGAQNRKAAESEEEVTPRRRERLPGNRRLARTGRRGREAERNATANVSPVQVDDGGRRRNRGHSPQVLLANRLSRSVSCFKPTSRLRAHQRQSRRREMNLRRTVRQTPYRAAHEAHLR